jgi:hypothetical protein
MTHDRINFGTLAQLFFGRFLKSVREMFVRATQSEANGYAASFSFSAAVPDCKRPVGIVMTYGRSKAGLLPFNSSLAA